MPTNQLPVTHFIRQVNFFILIVVTFAFGGRRATIADDGFSTDPEAAIKQAVAEDKDILMLFTGSDWCPPCKKLEKEVLGEKAFLDEIAKTYVLIKFDFPRKNPLDAALQKQNQTWAEKYSVSGYPTVILTDSKLKPFAFAGYQEGGVSNYLEMLETSRQLRIKRDEKMQAASAAKGAARAKLLDEAIDGMGESVSRVYYSKVVEEIIAIDKKNELGLRKKWNADVEAENRKVIMTDLLMMSQIGKPEVAIRLMDDVIREMDFSDAEKLTIYQMKLNLVKKTAPDQVDAVLDQMLALKGVAGETKQRLIAKKVYLMAGAGRRKEAFLLLDKTLVGNGEAGYLYLAKGELHASSGELKSAIDSFSAGLKTNSASADLRTDLTSAKADALYANHQPEIALKTLDDFAENRQMPSELRAEILLHKSMLMREMNRGRLARLAENRAIEVTESPEERSAIQKMVLRLRQKYDK